MKTVILFAICCFAVTQAYDDIDWSKVKIKEINPFTKKYVVRDLYIVGGQEAAAHSFPYQAALLITANDGLNYFCGGSLISNNYAMTAAHCVDNARFVTVILGAHRCKQPENSQVHLRVESVNITVHSGWDLTTLENDIAVLRLPETIVENEKLQIVKLPSSSDIPNDFAGDVGTVTGWGLDSDTSTTTSNVLRWVDVEVITNRACADIFGEYVHASNICVAGTDGKGSCSGDSGGPFVFDNKQIGLVSYGAAAGCELGYPSGFTRTTSFFEWISANTDVVIS